MSKSVQFSEEPQPLITQMQADQVINVLGALVEIVGRGSAAAIVLQQARNEIASLALSQPAVVAKRKKKAA